MSDAPRSDSFCVLPWLHLFADETGLLYPCCRSVGSRKPNVDRTGRPFRVFESGALETAWNSDYMRGLRRDMIDGRRHAACERCYHYDDLGMRSHRQDANAEYADAVAGLVAATDADGTAPLDLRSVDLRLGNLCNLRCRMCSPQSSKGLIGEFAAAYGLAPGHRLFDELRRLDWFADDRFWSIFERHTPHIERLHFAGGEPLLIPQMFDFLDRLVTTGRAAAVSLSYNTNLTVVPDRVYALWPHFRDVTLMVSLDGIAEVNTLIRYPSEWAVIDDNLRRCDRDAARLNLGGGLGTNTTVQILNVLRLDELLAYLASDAFTHLKAPNMSVLTHPAHFSVQALPAGLKAEATRRLTLALSRLAPHWPARWAGDGLDAMHAGLTGVLSFMHEADTSGSALGEFHRWTAVQDSQRGQVTRHILPELAPVWETTA
jgi:sulfatase maturation enzyme AslB (radical SAM superfamily)